MTFELPDVRELTTESDIEQKLIHPLWVAEPPFDLGLRKTTILTKTNIRRFPIGKGNGRRIELQILRCAQDDASFWGAELFFPHRLRRKGPGLKPGASTGRCFASIR